MCWVHLQICRWRLAGATGAEKLTRVGQRNLRTRTVAEASANGRDDESHDGTDAADDDGPEDGGLVAGSPLDVETRGRPELYGSHCGYEMCGIDGIQVVVNCLLQASFRRRRWSWRGLSGRQAWHWQLSAYALRVYGGRRTAGASCGVTRRVRSFSVQSRHSKHEGLPVFAAAGPRQLGPGIKFHGQPSAGSPRGSR